MDVTEGVWVVTKVLVVTVTLISATILQSFSWSWYKDDEERMDCPHNQACKNAGLCVMHIFQMGMPLRFIKALVTGYKAAFKQEDTHMAVIYEVTDLSMLRLFEAFLETIPQLVLQTFILLVSADREYIQYGSVIASCMSISWATLDYYAALKKSLSTQRRLTCGFPYKLQLMKTLIILKGFLMKLMESCLKFQQ
ncbi:hypothetical protein scyTo_0015321 [Scyliorhinus torazame]|uniref:XK-related protein n=1 Tax=Scyliorhinus torazame TaxID=75743 RepID=A0A401PQN0_SCYTO|nr:hypothetical protein [Scyliorhinus torazame]